MTTLSTTLSPLSRPLRLWSTREDSDSGTTSTLYGNDEASHQCPLPVGRLQATSAIQSMLTRALLMTSLLMTHIAFLKVPSPGRTCVAQPGAGSISVRSRLRGILETSLAAGPAAVGTHADGGTRHHLRVIPASILAPGASVGQLGGPVTVLW